MIIFFECILFTIFATAIAQYFSHPLNYFTLSWGLTFFFRRLTWRRWLTKHTRFPIYLWSYRENTIAQYLPHPLNYFPLSWGCWHFPPAGWLGEDDDVPAPGGEAEAGAAAGGVAAVPPLQGPHQHPPGGAEPAGKLGRASRLGNRPTTIYIYISFWWNIYWIIYQLHQPSPGPGEPAGKLAHASTLVQQANHYIYISLLIYIDIDISLLIYIDI